jgi:hypothetical protein
MIELKKFVRAFIVQFFINFIIDESIDRVVLSNFEIKNSRDDHQSTKRLNNQRDRVRVLINRLKIIFDK